MLRLNAEINKALAGTVVPKGIASRGGLGVGGTPEEFAQHVRKETDRLGKLIKAVAAGDSSSELKSFRAVERVEDLERFIAPENRVELRRAMRAAVDEGRKAREAMWDEQRRALRESDRATKPEPGSFLFELASMRARGLS